MGIVTDLTDRLMELAAARAPWEKHWREVAKYALPDIDRFDAMFSGGWSGTMAAINAVVGEPVAAQMAPGIYDQTSLWAVERGTAGFMSLVTPASEKWHGVKISDPFAGDPTDEEKRWQERYRDYLHAMRANPASGFWLAHKTAMRGIWGLGTSVVFVSEQVGGGASTPVSYRYVPLSENYMASNFEGVIDTDFRAFTRSARQCVEKWGDKCSAETKAMASDPKRRDQLVEILHAVFPRSEMTDKRRPGTLGADFVSFYVERKSKHLIGEAGFFSFPYVVHHWNRSGQGPYATGPMAIALAEVKSLNFLSQHALMAAQQAVNPPMGYVNDGMTRPNLNPGAPNKGAVSEEGRLLAQPLIMAARPDFAQVVLEAKQRQLGTSLYIDVWQSILADPNTTATQALLKAHEKSEILGPAGSSVQAGLSIQFDRETDILERKNAFRPGEALEPPASMADRNFGVRFTSPLDRMQRSSEFIGMQSLTEFALALASAGKPEVLDRLDVDEMLDIAQEILNAPRKALKSVDRANADREQRAQLEQMMQAIQAAKEGGDAASAAAGGLGALSGLGAAGTPQSGSAAA